MTKPLSDRDNKLQHAETGSRDLQAAAGVGLSPHHTNASMPLETVACLPIPSLFSFICEPIYEPFN